MGQKEGYPIITYLSYFIGECTALSLAQPSRRTIDFYKALIANNKVTEQ